MCDLPVNVGMYLSQDSVVEKDSSGDAVEKLGGGAIASVTQRMVEATTSEGGETVLIKGNGEECPMSTAKDGGGNRKRKQNKKQNENTNGEKQPKKMKKGETTKKVKESNKTEAGPSETESLQVKSCNVASDLEKNVESTVKVITPEMTEIDSGKQKEAEDIKIKDLIVKNAISGRVKALNCQMCNNENGTVKMLNEVIIATLTKVSACAKKGKGKANTRKKLKACYFDEVLAAINAIEC